MKRKKSLGAQLKQLAQMKSESQRLVKALVKNMRSVLKSLDKANEVLITFQESFPGKRRQVRRSKGNKVRKGRIASRRAPSSTKRKGRSEQAPAAEAQQS